MANKFYCCGLIIIDFRQFEMKVQFVEWKPNYYSLLNTSICLSLIIIPYITLNALELRVSLSKIYLHFSLINIIIITLPKICSKIIQ